MREVLLLQIPPLWEKHSYSNLELIAERQPFLRLFSYKNVNNSSGVVQGYFYRLNNTLDAGSHCWKMRKEVEGNITKR